jgi:hypothetical protein
MKYRYACQILMELEISGQIFEKNVKTWDFFTIRPEGAELLHSGRRTYRQEEDNCRFSQLSEGGLKTSQLMLYREIIAI